VGNLGQPGTPVAPAPTQAELTVRQVLQNLGYQGADQFSNDHQALQNLVAQARHAQENQQLYQYGQQYLQHAPQFQQWLQAQEQQRQAQAQQQQNWWSAPEFNAEWQHQIYQDPTSGELRVKPGAPLDALQKYNAWRNHQTNFLNNFSRDPIGSIRPGIEQVVQNVASQMVQRALQAQQEQATAQQFIQQHGSWLHETDQNGQPVADPRTGRPALSSLGQSFARHVFEAERMGLMDSASQQRYAMTALQRDFLLARYQAAQQPQNQGVNTPVPPTPGQAQKDSFLQQAAAAAAQNPGQPLGQTQGQYQSPQGFSTRGLADAMLNDLRAAGFQPGQQLVG
jgi:hypothetical protein